MAPSLLPDNNSLWFNFTEARDKMESRWQPAESVAAAARTALVVNFVDSGRLLVSCSTQNRKQLQHKNYNLHIVFAGT